MTEIAAPAPPLLRQPAFRRFWFGQSVSFVGDEVSLLAVLWLLPSPMLRFVEPPAEAS